jgi:hypothetical protein
MKKTAWLIIAGLFLLIPMSVEAWGGRTHKKITSDAYFIMPAPFREFLGEKPGAVPRAPNLRALLDACVEPDSILKDFRNHVFHIHGYNLGNGPFHVETLAKEIIEDIKAKAPMKKVVQKLGWLAHYIGDLAQPLHTGVATWEGIEEKEYHSKYEKAIDKQIYSYGVLFDGCYPTNRISARMIYEALWANKFYSAVETAYTNGSKYEAVKELTAQCYSRAVNNVVDIWYSIWVASGGKVNPKIDGRPKYYPPQWKKRLLESQEIEAEEKSE